MPPSGPRPPLGYRALAALATRLLPLAGPFHPKLAQGDRERRLATRRWLEWARRARDPARPLLWAHAPSVGEGLQAGAVLAILRHRHPEWQIAFSFFSPSAATRAREQPADVADYLPYDTAATMTGLVTALLPTAMVFTKADLWPELATAVHRSGAKVGMIAATVSPVSGRLGLGARALTRAGYRVLDLVGAVSPADGERLGRLGVAPDRVVVSGDPRFDSAAARVTEVPADDPLRRFTAGAPTLVAGSTWGPDERVILAAFAAVRRSLPNARLVVVPHEPSEAHLRRLEAVARSLGLPSERLGQASADRAVPNLVIGDRVGILSTLYLGAAAAYVGGGFGRAGLHSVLEPAAAGVPILIGPRWQSSREAGILLERGAAVAVPAGAGSATTALTDVWIRWLRTEPERIDRGRRAAEVVRAGLGAAERNAEVVERLMTA